MRFQILANLALIRERRSVRSPRLHGRRRPTARSRRRTRLLTIEPLEPLVLLAPVVATIGLDSDTVNVSLASPPPGGSTNLGSGSVGSPVTNDSIPPSSHVSFLPEITLSTDFQVTWSGEDGIGGSGIAGFDVFVSTDHQSYDRWQQNVTETSAVFHGQNGHTYSFYSEATDQAGNRESMPVTADATTTISPTTISISTDHPDGSSYGDTVTFTAHVSGGGLGAGTPTGSVQWWIDEAAFGSPLVLSGATSQVIADDLAEGTHSVAVRYTSDSPDFVDGESPTLTQVVDQAGLTVVADNQWKVYGSDNPALTGHVAGLQHGDPITVSFTTAATSASSVGFYPIQPVLSDPEGQLSHYRLFVVEGTLSVAPAPLTISVDNQTMVYGGTMPELTASYAGFVNGDTVTSLSTRPTLATLATPASHVGNYPITVSGAVAANYSLTFANGMLSVTPAALTIAADDKVMVYGASLPTLTASYTGLANGDTPSSLGLLSGLTTLATAASHVGLYPITVRRASLPDYVVTPLDGVLTIDSAELTITALDASQVYGESLPQLTASYRGFVNGDTADSMSVPPTLSTSATAGSHVGSYPITAEGAWAADYTIRYVDGTLLVTPAALTITADWKSKSYGAPLPELTLRYDGFVNGDTVASLSEAPTLATSATAASHVGSYPILAEGASTADYTINYVDGTLVVTQVALTIAADPKSKSYGAPLPALAASYRGLVNGDTVASLTTPATLATTATVASHAGDYPITASGAVAPDYAISYVPSSLTVTPAYVTIDQAADQADPTNQAPIHFTAVFGQPVSDFTADSLALGGTALGPLTASASPLGSDGMVYDITVSGMKGTGTVTVGLVAGNGDLIVSSTDNTVTYRPWQNTRNPADVNDQGGATPLDVLMIINYINAYGAGPLPTPPPSPGPPAYVDVDGDGLVTAQDVLAVINYINSQNAVGTVQPEGESAPRAVDSTAAAPLGGRSQLAANAASAVLAPAMTQTASELGGLITSTTSGVPFTLARSSTVQTVTSPDMAAAQPSPATAHLRSAEWETLLNCLAERGTRRGSRPDQVDQVFTEFAADLPPA